MKSADTIGNPCSTSILELRTKMYTSQTRPSQDFYQGLGAPQYFDLCRLYIILDRSLKVPSALRPSAGFHYTHTVRVLSKVFNTTDANMLHCILHLPFQHP
jgi:hypothetical protein